MEERNTEVEDASGKRMEERVEVALDMGASSLIGYCGRKISYRDSWRKNEEERHPERREEGAEVNGKQWTRLVGEKRSRGKLAVSFGWASSTRSWRNTRSRRSTRRIC